MTPGEYGDLKQVYKFSIAYDAFTEVSKACEQIISRGLKSDDPLYHVMTVGIVTLYSRPFTTSLRIGRLSTSLVPAQFKWVHSSLMNLRDKAFAHSDFDGQLVGHGKMTDLRISIDRSRAVFFSSRSTVEPPLIPQIQALSNQLADQVRRSRDNFYKRVLNAILPTLQPDDVGKELVLNLEDEKGPMILRSTDPIRLKYPVIRPFEEPPLRD